MKWQYFLGAVILAVYFLVSAGAPVVPIAAGVAIAGYLTYRKYARSKAH